MLVTLKEALADAKKNNYGIGMFGAYNMETIRAVVEAGEEMRSPVILGFAEGHIPLNKIQIEDIWYPMVHYAKRASVPVVVHLDHGFTYENVIKAIHYNFTSVMFDASSESFERNVEVSAEISRVAHAVGCSVEAEIGHVGGHEQMYDEDEEEAMYTKPEDARRFVEQTGIDALAVAIGTVHGPYRKQPKLDIDRLERIHSMVDVPLVLHGGSGLSAEDFRATIDGGVRKINIFTDLSVAGYRGAATVADEPEDKRNILTLTEAVVASYKEEVKRYTEIFRSSGKA